MGTRGLNVIVSNGKVKVALYNQWDSYPSGQGMTTLEFFRDKFSEDFVRKVNGCSWINQEEHKAMWVSVGADPNSDMVSMDVSKKFSEKYPWLHRDCGAKIYDFINDSENGLKTQDSMDFACDSLFCEWAYVIDLDKKTFEVYKGFNTKPLEDSERFSILNEKCKGEEYYPVKFVKSYSLSSLPTNEEFLEDLEPKNDEEE